MPENNPVEKPVNDVPAPSQKDVHNGQVKKKAWRIKSKEGMWLNFYPIFEVNEELRQVECRLLQMEFMDEKTKKPITFTFDWLNMYMFVYYTCNEELRMGLAQRYERKVNYIPYDVTVKIDPQEKEAGIAKRRVQLPVDELTMAIARNEAWQMLRRTMGKSGGKIPDPRQFMYKGRKKI